MGCDICRAEAQISISESDKCLIPSSTFQHFSCLSEYVLEYTHLRRIFAHLNSPISTPRPWPYGIMDTNNITKSKNKRRLLNGSWRFVRVLVLCISRPFCMEITQFWNGLCDRVSLKDNQFVRGKNIYNAYTVIFTRHREKSKMIDIKSTLITILWAFYLNPCGSSENGLCVHYTFACQITGNPRYSSHTYFSWIY